MTDNEKLERLGEALESMVWQHAYRIVKRGKLMLSTGGLSANEEAFAVLGWDDPHEVESEGLKCEVFACREWATSGTHWGDLYLRLCSKHLEASSFRWGGQPKEPGPLPKIEQWALDHEATRDPITRRLPLVRPQ